MKPFSRAARAVSAVGKVVELYARAVRPRRRPARRPVVTSTRHGVRVVFGLGQQVGRDHGGVGRVVGEDHQLRRAGEHVDAHPAGDQLLGRGDVTVARSDDDVAGGHVARAVGQGRDGLGSAGGEQRVGAGYGCGGQGHGVGSGRGDPHLGHARGPRGHGGHQHRGGQGEASPRRVAAGALPPARIRWPARPPGMSVSRSCQRRRAGLGEVADLLGGALEQSRSAAASGSRAASKSSARSARSAPGAEIAEALGSSRAAHPVRHRGPRYDDLGGLLERLWIDGGRAARSGPRSALKPAQHRFVLIARSCRASSLGVARRGASRAGLDGPAPRSTSARATRPGHGDQGEVQHVGGLADHLVRGLGRGEFAGLFD